MVNMTREWSSIKKMQLLIINSDTRVRLIYLYYMCQKSHIFFQCSCFISCFFSLLFMCCLYNIVGQCSLKYYIWAKKWPLSFHRRIHVVAAYYWYIDIYMGMSSWICSWFCSLVSFQHHIGAFLLREGPVKNKTWWNFAR